ncbi:MAG: hypothetical protein IT535_13785 [Bauldia sp.]|nr:hypothetical protein [Bauldia sp.]
MSLQELVNAVSAWVKSVRPGAELALRGLADPNTDGLSLRVLALRSANDSRHALARRDPIVDILEVDLLLSVGGSEPEAAMETAADLHFAALEAAPPFTLNASADALKISRGLRLTPALGIVLRGRIARERAARPVPLVREAKFELVGKNAVDGGGPAPPPAPESASPEPAAAATPSRRRPARRGGT